MPKRKTTPEAEVSATPATESAAKSRKSAAKPKAATTAASHRHTRKPAQSTEVELEAPAVSAVTPQQESKQEPVRVTTHEGIARLAYSYWVARGYQGGSPEEDWLRAERELTILA